MKFNLWNRIHHHRANFEVSRRILPLWLLMNWSSSLITLDCYSKYAGQSFFDTPVSIMQLRVKNCSHIPWLLSLSTDVSLSLGGHRCNKVAFIRDLATMQWFPLKLLAAFNPFVVKWLVILQQLIEFSLSARFFAVLGVSHLHVVVAVLIGRLFCE